MVIVAPGEKILSAHINAKLDQDNSDNKPSAHFQPETTSIYDLGTSSLKWRDGYYSGNLSIGGNISTVEIITVNSKVTPDTNGGASLGESTKGFDYVFLKDTASSDVYRVEIVTLSGITTFSDDAETGSTPAGQYPVFWANGSGGTYTGIATYSTDFSYAGTKSFKITASNNANETNLIFKPDKNNFKTDFTVKFMFYWDGAATDRLIEIEMGDLDATTATNRSVLTNYFGWKVGFGNTDMTQLCGGNASAVFTQALGSTGWKSILMQVNSIGQGRIKFEGSTVVDFGSTTLINVWGAKCLHLVCEGTAASQVWYFDNFQMWEGTTDTPPDETGVLQATLI